MSGGGENSVRDHKLQEWYLNSSVILYVGSKNIVAVCIIYNYWLGSRTTAVLFDQRTNLFPDIAGLRQQIRFRVKQNYCCPGNQSITVLLYTFIFFQYCLILLDVCKTLMIVFIQQYENMDNAHRYCKQTQLKSRSRDLLNHWKCNRSPVW